MPRGPWPADIHAGQRQFRADPRRRRIRGPRVSVSDTRHPDTAKRPAMIRFLKALILLPIAILIILLAVANRAPVQLSLDPFSQDAPEIATNLPLFAVIFASVMVGIVIGGTATWLSQGKHR